MIASSLTSPLDALYLAVIFDPIFTASYPSTRLVHRVSLFQAMLRAFSYPRMTPPLGVTLVDLQTLLLKHPNRAVVVFPECTTTNGRGILPFSPSLLATPTRTKIFPISLRYTTADITTPIPGSYRNFLWSLLSQPTHCIRVRIAESIYNNPQDPTSPLRNYPSQASTPDDTASSSDTLLGSEEGDGLTAGEIRVLNKVADALARLGRVKKVGLGVREKIDFVKVWARQRNRR